MSLYPVADAIIALALLVFVSLIVVTMEGTRRSMERTECYRTAKAVSDCPPPAWWEEALRKTLL